jgi:histone-lysine N-methyltransferase SETMAR
LTGGLSGKRQQYARVNLAFVHAAEWEGWHHLVTGHESWFFFNFSSRRIWTLSRDDVVIKPRHDIQSKKTIFLIIWNPSGFYIVDRFPNHAKMNSADFVTNLLIPVEQPIFPRGRAPHERRPVVYLDNCFVQANGVSTDWHKEYSIPRMPHSPYSYDLAPCDFYLFPTVKEKLERIQLADEDKFFERLQKILRGLDQLELNTVFQAWMLRVQEVSEGNGD